MRKIGLVSLGLLLLAGLSTLRLRALKPVPAPRPATTLAPTDIGKWAIRYDDSVLGIVTGTAYCSWMFRWCDVRVRNPVNGETFSLRAQDSDIQAPVHADDNLVLALHGASPSVAPISNPSQPARRLLASPGSSAKITIKNGDVEQTKEFRIENSATVDLNQVKLTLEQTSIGTLDGYWSYLVTPLTERDFG